jgi:hypothetical protein
MARSKYVYVLTWADRVESAAPLLTATVKYEFLDALAGLNGLEDTDVWRMGDGVPLDRNHLGTGAEFLARERP